MRHHGTPPSPQASANMVPAKSFGQFSKKQNPGDPLRIQNKTRQGESMAYLCIYIWHILYSFSCIYIFHGNVYLIFPYVSSCQIRCFQAPGSGMHTSTCWWQRLGGRFPHPKPGFRVVASAGPRTENQETCCWVQWPRILGHGWMFLDSCWLLVMQFWRQHSNFM